MIRWTEKQLSALMPWHKQPAKRAKRKPPSVPMVMKSNADVYFLLPYLTPMASQWMRMHFRSRRRAMDKIADVASKSFVATPAFPMASAHVVITRYSSVEPDPDNLSFVKPILDALQPPSKRHPYGVGIIQNDSSAVLSHEVRYVKSKPGEGRVTVEIYHGKRKP